MAKKPKATENKAKDVETKGIIKGNRKDLAAELGELTIVRSNLVAQTRQIDARMNQIAEQMENLGR